MTASRQQGLPPDGSAPQRPRRRLRPPAIFLRRSPGGTTTPPPTLLVLAAAAAALLASSSSVGVASAFRLTSLLPFWGESESSPSSKESEEDDDPLAALAYPRRDLAEALGEETYRTKVAEALGNDSGGDGEEEGAEKQCEDGAPQCRRSPGHGVDVSFPMHHPPSTDFYRRDFYDEFMRGCRTYYGSHAAECDRHESDRLEMNRNQPRIMRNYTDVGIWKVKAPEGLYRRLREFWDVNRNRQVVEKWGRGNTYVNHWESPTYMVNLDNPRLPGGGPDLRNAVWDGARALLQKWTAQSSPLSASSLYGIRVYREGAVLAPHVDRLPLVSSAIINVDQDVDEPWPLEVIAHDGRAYNLTLEPGEMVLYESHSVIHGRPYPLRGRYYANVFVHFEPRGHSLRHGERMEAYLRDGRVRMESDEELYRRAMEKVEVERSRPPEKKSAAEKVGGSAAASADDDLPDYIARGTPEEKRWRQQYKPVEPGTTTVTAISLDDATRGTASSAKKRGITITFAHGSGSAHRAASGGDLAVIRDIASHPEQRNLLFKEDENGWQPLHEAARGGHTEIVRELIKEGADVNVRTNQGRGGNALWLAEKEHGEDHPTSKLLRKAGATAEGPKGRSGGAKR